MKNEQLFEILENAGGKPYFVGGYVRDILLGKDPKDIDILVTGITYEKLNATLLAYGKVDLVGDSFGIIKFKPNGTTSEELEFDIALPRRERKIGDGHKDFAVTVDINMSIEEELTRRDFTINAMAMSINGDIIDPFGGLLDLESKLVRMVNPYAFSEDPLRMLRAIQFSSRFGFDIEDQTFIEIKNNYENIREITSERIMIEFGKIVTKGDPKIGADLLFKTKLFKGIFGDIAHESDINRFVGVTNLGEFIWYLTVDAFVGLLTSTIDIVKFHKNDLKGDVKNNKIIAAMQILNDRTIGSDLVRLFRAYKISPDIITIGTLSRFVEDDWSDYPISLKQLQLNGDDLEAIGLVGKEIGDTLDMLAVSVLTDKVKNNKIELLNYIK